MKYDKEYQFTTEVSPTFMKAIFPFVRGKKVLDVGCGEGGYLKHFGQGSFGLDLADKNLEKARGKGLRVKKMNFNNPQPLPEKFEAVFLSHILEHLENPISMLRYSWEQLEKDGLLIVSLPNEASLIHLKYPYFTRNGNHLYSFSPSNLIELMLYTNFQPLHLELDFYTNLTHKIGLNPFLAWLRFLPNSLQLKAAWAYWGVARKK